MDKAQTKWGAPTPRTYVSGYAGKGKWQQFARELCQRPGEWGILSASSRAAAAGARNRLKGTGLQSLALKGHFEATIRESTVYARCVNHPVENAEDAANR